MAHPQAEIADDVDTGAAPVEIAIGALRARIESGAIRCVALHGVEAVRAVDCPIRDMDWGTAVPELISETLETVGGAAVYRRRFTVFDGGAEATLTARFGPDQAARVDFELRARAAFSTNRAGLTLLHPIQGVAGAPLAVIHPDGRETGTRFPELISPGQPVFDIAGLRHAVQGVEVDILFDGEVFEMEDQRNWSDASFKTYCRPLGAPRPYRIEAGETVRQSVVIRLSGAPRPGRAAAVEPARTAAALPEVALAADGAWGVDPDCPFLAATPGAPLLLRLAADAADGAAPRPLPRVDRTMDLELVTADDADAAKAIADIAGALTSLGARPRSVVALPRAYLASHQPEGPWPDGPQPADAAAWAAAAFDGAAIGIGMLTNFTELNRCPPPDGIGDHVTYSTTAIVHAADDRSVLQTLEALPQIHASARALSGGRPLRLGLATIGMRTNPYGAAVAENPGLARLAMASDDPRQRTVFGAVFAIGAYAAAAQEGCARIALAGLGGPFATGARTDGSATAWPILHAVRALSRLSTGAPAEGPRCGAQIVGVAARMPDGRLAGVYANRSFTPASLDATGADVRLLTAETDATALDWLDAAPPTRAERIALPPLSAAFLDWESA
jgi:hypothetical protein